MEEENKKPENEEKVEDKVGKPEDTGEGDKSKLAIETEAANAAAERMETAKEELEAAEARTRLGGTTEAGSVKEEKVKTKEEAAKAYIKENFENLK